MFQLAATGVQYPVYMRVYFLVGYFFIGQGLCSVLACARCVIVFVVSLLLLCNYMRVFIGTNKLHIHTVHGIAGLLRFFVARVPHFKVFLRCWGIICFAELIMNSRIANEYIEPPGSRKPELNIWPGLIIL